MKLVEEICNRFREYKQLRHEFHHHPELSFKEHATAKKVAELLRSYNVDEVHENIGGTGVVGVIHNGSGPSIGLRADMDALPIHELGAHSYASCNEGVMHACGHDGHVVMLLAAAQYLSETRRFNGTVVLIFQPAEEEIKGAPAMLNDGLLERFPFSSIYTLHSWPGADTDHLFVNPGAVMAAVNNFTITIKGTGGHAAMPHLSPDPVIAGAEIILAMQTLVSRCSNPQDPLVVSCTVFQAGQVHNVIPELVTIKGTTRFLNTDIAQWLPDRMHHIIEGIARAHQVSATMDYRPQCPATYNNDREAAIAQAVIDELSEGKQFDKGKSLSMGSDDFCFYLEEVPGAYVYLGNGKSSKSLHHPEYDFNDESLLLGASFYARLVERTQP